MIDFLRKAKQKKKMYNVHRNLYLIALFTEPVYIYCEEKAQNGGFVFDAWGGIHHFFETLLISVVLFVCCSDVITAFLVWVNSTDLNWYFTAQRSDSISQNVFSNCMDSCVLLVNMFSCFRWLGFSTTVLQRLDPLSNICNWCCQFCTHCSILQCWPLCTYSCWVILMLFYGRILLIIHFT